MCLIITGTATKIRSTLLNTHGMLNDIYTSNPDGIGIMYATTKGLKVTKVLPKSYADAQQFISKLPNDERQLAIHFRWTTHGHTNMENCHPYDVVKGYVAMMHNGVLHTGNAADKAKSDTWHFIQDFLASPVAEHPALVHNDKFLDMLAEFIGDNRFVFMDGEGKISHVNYDQGIEHDGLWFSNTYAWTPSRLIPAYQTSSRYGKRYSSTMYSSAYDYDDTYGGFTHAPYDIQPRKLSAHDPKWDEADYMWDDEEEVTELDISAEAMVEALMSGDVDAITSVFEEHPEQAVHIMCNVLECEATHWAHANDMTKLEASIYQAFLAGDTVGLLTAIDNGVHGNVADVACYYLNWTNKLAPASKQPLPALLS